MTDTAALLDTTGLRCPVCQSALEPAGPVLLCKQGHGWPAPGGVAHFGDACQFPQDFTPNQIAELLKIAEVSGWQAALHDHMRPVASRHYRHAVDEYRAQWRCLIPSHPYARLLDFRCGWGAVTVSLAEDYGEIVAADTHPALASFTALRARANEAANVRAVCLDPCQRLPFEDGYFDVVVLQSALEWGRPGHLLREVARVMASGGVLCVHVPNRLDAARLLQIAQRWLMGRTATAAGLAAVPASPPLLRTLADNQRLLAQAGFGAGPAYAVLPSVAEPFYLVPLGSNSSLQFFLDHLFNDASLHLALAERNLLTPYHLARALWQGLRYLPFEPVLRHFMPGYALLARRG